MTTPTVEVQVGESGKLVIPEALRHQLDIVSGDRLVARIDEGRLILEKAETIKQRLKQRFSHLKGQGMVEELIAHRRADAAQEDG